MEKRTSVANVKIRNNLAAADFEVIKTKLTKM